MGAETPLHFSAAAGQLDFVREPVKVKTEFAREMNPEGFSLMHLASANGCPETMRDHQSRPAALLYQKKRRKSTFSFCSANWEG